MPLKSILKMEILELGKIKIYSISNLICLITFFNPLIGNAQYTWQKNLTTKTYSILQNGTPVIKDIEKFYGMSIEKDQAGGDFEVEISMSPEMEAELEKKQKNHVLIKPF